VSQRVALPKAARWLSTGPLSAYDGPERGS
jgi:hypothetical protein